MTTTTVTEQSSSKSKQRKEGNNLFFSGSSRTLEDWTGSAGYYKLLWRIEIWGFKFVFWRHINP